MNITAHDGALHRIERLKKAIKIATAICGLSDEQAECLIFEVHDNRGNLTIHWNMEPTAVQKNAFAVAWEQFKEDPKAIHHITLTFQKLMK